MGAPASADNRDEVSSCELDMYALKQSWNKWPFPNHGRCRRTTGIGRMWPPLTTSVRLSSGRSRSDRHVRKAELCSSVERLHLPHQAGPFWPSRTSRAGRAWTPANLPELTRGRDRPYGTEGAVEASAVVSLTRQPTGSSFVIGDRVVRRDVRRNVILQRLAILVAHIAVGVCVVVIVA
jgi:hypothetical protein